MGYSWKNKQTEGGEDFFLTLIDPGIFQFFTLPLEFKEKSNTHPWKSCKILLNPLEIPQLKNQDSWKFH